jgi:hypothetical protein
MRCCVGARGEGVPLPADQWVMTDHIRKKTPVNVEKMAIVRSESTGRRKSLLYVIIFLNTINPIGMIIRKIHAPARSDNTLNSVDLFSREKAMRMLM